MRQAGVASRALFASLLAVVAAVSVTTPAKAGHDGNCRIDYEDGDLCLYQDINNGGGMLDFTRTDKDYTSAADYFYEPGQQGQPTGWNVNDAASALKNRELTCEWYVFEDIEWGGDGFRYPYGLDFPDLRYLNIGNWNDRISSHYKWTGTQECTNGSTGQ
ncbi:peptidase inhibitor family I36 protein [Microbispora catharanthi]|uniref:Peptidase inhibitor family I36 protein n=1 Tax=Microbispora catharanthi TaxID=1712871 RepID=A0A5N6BKK6_9ACTN|nr:peptidase inhibitor family I36 protein [Microbispora catharanthi]KAB8180780.1 hypothetical protein FH610_031390 [Microbispora catharanthi]